MPIDEQHVALPKLYGAPAYARPAAPVEASARPFDPDDLPLESLMNDEEIGFVSSLPARAYAPGGTYLLQNGEAHANGNGNGTLKGRPFSLRAIAGRLLGGD